MSVLRMIGLVIAVLLPGCTTGDHTSRGELSWPVQTYDTHSFDRFMPFEPVCLTGVDGFRYPGEFAACRQSVANYIDALDGFYRCRGKKLRLIFDRLLVDVRATYNCFVDFYANDEDGSPSHCPTVVVPPFYGEVGTSGIGTWLGVPFCVKNDGLVPASKISLISCTSEVETFLGTGRFFATSSAQEQYDKYMRSLASLIDEKQQDAIDKFTCIADGRKYCF